MNMENMKDALVIGGCILAGVLAFNEAYRKVEESNRIDSIELRLTALEMQ